MFKLIKMPSSTAQIQEHDQPNRTVIEGLNESIQKHSEQIPMLHSNRLCTGKGLSVRRNIFSKPKPILQVVD